jgi:hypothetical protein
VEEVVYLRNCYSKKYVLLWGKWFIYGAAIISENMSWCERSFSFTELLFTGNMVCVGKVIRLRNCYLQETCVGVGQVVYLQSFYSKETCVSVIAVVH